MSNQFLPPVTHWIGGEMRGNNAYFRGMIDAAAKDLKRWVRTKRIKEVSIFGYPDLQQNRTTGEMDVIGYEPLSIDWTPLHRPGMPTRIIGMEMEDITGEQLDGTFEQLKRDLNEASKEHFLVGDNDYIWTRSIRYDNNTFIVEHEKQNEPTKLYEVSFTVADNEVAIGDKTEVVERRVYEPAGEMNKGGKEMTFEEMMEKLKNQITNGQITYGQVLGEMGITPTNVAAEMEEIKTAVEAKDTLDQVSEALGISGEMDIIEVAKEGKKAMDDSRKEGFEKILNKAIEEKVSGEIAQGLVKKMLQVEEGATEEKIAGEIDKILADDFMKKVLSDNHLDQGTGLGTGAENNTSGLTTRRAQI